MCFTKVGEGLTFKMRIIIYERLLRMRPSWFDIPNNNAGTLASRLQADCQLIQGLTSNIIGVQIGNLVSFATGLAVAFSHSWAVTLVALGCSPVKNLLQFNFIKILY
jgi:ATP-binding cassette subfamily B (MDR/TAP) protein 1